MLSDLRLAVRSLAKSPGFTAVIVFTLALGIGANTAIFSFFRGILLRPLPYEAPEHVVILKKEAHDFGDPVGVEVGLRAADFRELQVQTQTVQEMATYTLDSATLTGRGPGDLVTPAIVSPNFFSMLGSRAAVGRTFASADTSAGASGRLAVLAHSYWQTRFDGSPAIIGETVILNNVPFTVVGIMPEDFVFPRDVQAWVTPVAVVPEDAIGQPTSNIGGRGNNLRTILARLKPGTSLEQAEMELAALVGHLPNPNAVKRQVHLVNMRDQSVGEVRPALALLLGCVGLVLLITCLNVANLMLSRATARQRELGIRLALGSSRGRIARHLFSECLVLSLLGGGMGVLLSSWGLDLLVHAAPADIPRLMTVHMDASVLGFALIISILTGLACGVAPVLGTAKTDLVTATKTGDRGGSAGAAPRRLRAAMVAGQVAISCMLLVAAGLLLRSLEKMQAFPWGFDPTQVVSARVAFLGDRYRGNPARLVFYRTLLEKLAAVKEFDSVGTSLDRIGRTWIHLPLIAEGQVYPNPAEAPQASYHICVSPGYFRALGITLQQGRTFARTDDEKTENVVIIDTTLAKRIFPDGQAIGKRLKLPHPDGERLAEVVGVVTSVKSEGPMTASLPDVYVPYAQLPWNNFFVHVRTPVAVALAGETIKRIVHEIDRDVPVSDIASMEQVTAIPSNARKFPLGLLGGFALIALALATVGIYGVTSYGVVQRTREIGVRLALGAQPREIVSLMLGQGFRPIALGLVIGFAGSAVTAYAMRNLLFGVAPLDAPTFVFIPLLLAAIALVACWLPARRATKVDPIEALRAE